MSADHLVFVSHVSDDARVAGWLKETLNSHFLGIFRVFVSSDTESVDVGTPGLRPYTRPLTSAAS